MVPSSENGRLGRIEQKVDKILEKQSEIYKIVGEHGVQICEHEKDITNQKSDIKGLSKLLGRVGVGVILLLVAAVVAVSTRFVE